MHKITTPILKPVVIIPSFDRPASLRAACWSALAALPDEGQLVVIDDGLIHPAKQSLQEILDPRLKIFKTAGGSGPSAARNIGAKNTSADVLFFLDDDDILLPDYIRKTLDVLAMDDCDSEFGFSAAICGKKVICNRRTTGELAPDVALKHRLAGLGMGFWIKLSTFRSIGGLDETIFVNEDTDLCLRLAQSNTKGWYSVDPGVRLRPNQRAFSSNARFSLTARTSSQIRLKVYERLLFQYEELLDKSEDVRWLFAKRVAKLRRHFW